MSLSPETHARYVDALTSILMRKPRAACVTAFIAELIRHWGVPSVEEWMRLIGIIKRQHNIAAYASLPGWTSLDRIEYGIVDFVSTLSERYLQQLNNYEKRSKAAQAL